MKGRAFKIAVVSVSVCVVLVCFFFVGISILYPFSYKKEIAFCGEKYGVDKSLIASVIYCESRFKSDAISNKGAMGLMQIMPATAKNFFDGDFQSSVLLDPTSNIDIGTRYLRYLIDKYGDETTVLACYNAGEKAVRSWLVEGKLDESQIEYGETLDYIKKVQKMKKYYKMFF